MRVAFINAVGGRMLVDESRVDEYMAAGFKLAADVIDTTAKEVVEDEISEAAPAPAPKKKRKKEV